MALADNLMAAWELDEASGNAIDSHSSHDLTESSGTIGAASGPGGVGGSRDLEAIDTEHFGIADHADLSAGDIDWTFEVWVNHEDVSVQQFIIYKGSSVEGEYLLELLGTGKWRVRVWPGSGFTSEAAVTSTPSASAATWYQIIWGYDSAANQLFIVVNAGTPDTASHSTGTKDTAHQFSLGDGAILGAPLDALVSKCRLWKRVLTSDERTELYNSGLGRDYAYIVSGGAVGQPVWKRYGGVVFAARGMQGVW